MMHEYLIFEDRPAYPAKPKRYVDARRIANDWSNVWDSIPPTITHTRIVKAANQKEALDRARQLWPANVVPIPVVSTPLWSGKPTDNAPGSERHTTKMKGAE